MALRLTDAASWSDFFKSLGIPEDNAEQYGTTFFENGITESELKYLDKETLKNELKVKVLAHLIKILHCDESHVQQNPINKSSLPAKLPEFSSRMSSSDFRTAVSVWTTFKNIQPQAAKLANDLLYSACDHSVQKTINNTCADFRSLPEEQFLDKIKYIVTLDLNPLAHRSKFTDMRQDPGESITHFVARLLSVARDCEYLCPNETCGFDLTDWHVRDQLIKGISNTTLQADILSKCANQKALATLDEVVKHAIAFESALRDQETISSHSQLDSVSHVSTQYKKNAKIQNPGAQKPASNTKPCRGCGSLSHGSTEENRRENCPAWGKTCSHCHKGNHFKGVCFSLKRKSATIQSIANPEGTEKDSTVGAYSVLSSTASANMELTEISVFVTSAHCHDEHLGQTCNCKTTLVLALPDSGASVCVADDSYIETIGLKKDHLQHCNKIIRVVGGATIKCSLWANVKLKLPNYSLHTIQPLYFTETGITLRHLYMSKTACIELGILPKHFPLPPPVIASLTKTDGTAKEPCSISSNFRLEALPKRPTSLPFPPTDDYIPKLKQYILDSFKESAFNRSSPFPVMHGPPARIHLKPDAIPYARHTPIPIPLHMEQPAKQKLFEDVEKGIVKPVSPGLVTPWCSPMVTLLKKNGAIRRTIDLQRLNSQCAREAHYNPSPFKAACHIPPNTKKTILDIADGYHSIPLDEKSQPLTTFITPWGRFMNTRLIQGFKSAGDIFNRNLDLILEEANITKVQHVVDDLCLYEDDIQSAFYQTWDFLTLCVHKGIVFNPDKFVFCQDNVIFAGIKVTKTGLAPAPALLDSIKNFPPPSNIHDARSWHGLVNQVSWAYAISPIMRPFRDLIKKNAKFVWDATLQSVFEDSKAKLITLCEEGIKSFDMDRDSLIQCDWSKDGIGYLLLQKYCTCELQEAPNCCPDGWHLVYAGSRHTSPAERNYAPIEGEALAVTWSLTHAKSFILGCKRLIVVTDHKPLIPLFHDRHLSDIGNPRVQRFKSKAMQFNFTIQHRPGKWHRGADALSRSPVLSASQPSDKDLLAAEIEDGITQSYICDTLQAIHGTTNHNTQISDNQAITMHRLQNACAADQVQRLLSETISAGFPSTRQATPAELRPYWEVRGRLSHLDNNVVVLDNSRFVIPQQLRSTILNTLHSAHQGCTNMIARAKQCVYWPAMNKVILNFKNSCSTCSYIAPSQPPEPLIPSPPPQWPFQQICADLFHLNGNNYLAISDRFSGWVEIVHFHTTPTAASLKPAFEQLFTRFGCPEELSTDGGSQFTAQEFQTFLQNWGVKNRISSAHYPQSNGRAELAVKTSKRLVRDNLNLDGSLNSPLLCKALLQYRNTPLRGIGLSPAQLLFSRQLKDFMPIHPSNLKLNPQWTRAAKEREKALSHEYNSVQQRYDERAHALPPLRERSHVSIQNAHTKRWDRSGQITKCLAHRQYIVRMDGSGRIVTRNRRFLRPLLSKVATPPLISPTLVNDSSTLPSNCHQNSSPSSRDDNLTTPSPTAPTQRQQPPLNHNTMPLALRRLQPFNNPGLSET